ncbi:hypothetical protein FTE24_008945 [Saccharibacillus sp. WB 17]|nr:hypothetical protein [Saccharibacillus sp. WB 17]
MRGGYARRAECDVWVRGGYARRAECDVWVRGGYARRAECGVWARRAKKAVSRLRIGKQPFGFIPDRIPSGDLLRGRRLRFGGRVRIGTSFCFIRRAPASALTPARSRLAESRPAESCLREPAQIRRSPGASSASRSMISIASSGRLDLNDAMIPSRSSRSSSTTPL